VVIVGAIISFEIIHVVLSVIIKYPFVYSMEFATRPGLAPIINAGIWCVGIYGGVCYAAYYYIEIYLTNGKNNAENNFIFAAFVLAVTVRFFAIEPLFAWMMGRSDDDVYLPWREMRSYNAFEVPYFIKLRPPKPVKLKDEKEVSSKKSKGGKDGKGKPKDGKGGEGDDHDDGDADEGGDGNAGGAGGAGASGGQTSKRSGSKKPPGLLLQGQDGVSLSTAGMGGEGVLGTDGGLTTGRGNVTGRSDADLLKGINAGNLTPTDIKLGKVGQSNASLFGQGGQGANSASGKLKLGHNVEDPTLGDKEFFF